MRRLAPPFGTRIDRTRPLRFSFDGRELNLPETLHIVSNDRDEARRAQALATFSKGLTSQRFDRLMARTLNVVLGAKYVEDRERGYANPMSFANIGNRVDDDTVDGLRLLREPQIAIPAGSHPIDAAAQRSCRKLADGDGQQPPLFQRLKPQSPPRIAKTIPGTKSETRTKPLLATAPR